MNRDILALDLVTRANQQLFEGKYLEAIALYDLALEHEPESLTASQGRAFCKTLLLAQIPLEDHAVLVKSIVEDLESATDLSRVLLGDLLGT